MIPLNVYEISSWVWGYCIWIAKMYTNWKLKKKKGSEYSFDFFVQIYHASEENFFLNKRFRSIPYENKWFRKTRLECHLGAYIAITLHLRSEQLAIWLPDKKKLFAPFSSLSTVRLFGTHEGVIPYYGTCFLRPSARIQYKKRALKKQTNLLCKGKHNIMALCRILCFFSQINVNQTQDIQE